jgi:hypothetical protein
VGGDPEDVDRAGTDLHDEQGVQPLQADGVHMEEVGGEKAVGLGLEEGDPLAACRVTARGRSEAGGAKDAVDGGRADLVAEAA